MQLPRFVGFVDLAVLTVMFVAIVLPPREMYASAAMKGTETEHFALAFHEARTMAHPDDAVALADFSRRLGRAGFVDWSIEAANAGLARTEQSPNAWRTLLAASVAYVDRFDVVPALALGDRALTACVKTPETCPSWDQVRIRFYRDHLQAGVDSGIDPRKDPKGFTAAGQNDIRLIRLGTPNQ